MDFCPIVLITEIIILSMNKKNTFLVALTLLMFSNFVNAQVKSSNAEISKSLKKGIYGGTYALSNGNLGVFYQENGELVAYEFSSNAEYIGTHHGGEASQLLATAKDDESTNVKQLQAIEIGPDASLEVMAADNPWGTMRLENAKVWLSSTDKFIGGFEIQQTDKRKLKIEGTWKTNFVGARAIIPEGKHLYKFKAHNGRYSSFDFTKPTSPPIVPKGGALQTAGIVVEKVSIKDPSPYNMNRLVVFKLDFDGNESSEVHTMQYAMQAMGVGSDHLGNMTVLTMPVNAPSTYGPHKPLNAKEEERSNLYLYRFTKDNQFIDEQKIKSDLLTVNYQTVATTNKTFIIGTGSSKGKNYRMFYAGQSAMDAFAISMSDSDGKMQPFKTYTAKDFEAKLETFGAKFNMKFTNGPNFYSSSQLENGNVFIFGKSQNWHHGALISASGDLIKYFVFPHYDLSTHKMLTEQLEVRGNKIYLVLTDQPNELTNEAQTSTSTSSTTTYMGGGYDHIHGWRLRYENHDNIYAHKAIV